MEQEKVTISLEEKVEKVDIGRKKVDIKTKKLKFTVHGNWELGSHKQVEIPEK